MANRFYEDWAIVGTIDPTGTGASTTVTTDVVDMRDVEEVAFLISVGTVAATGTVNFAVKSGTTSGTVATAVTSITQLGASDDNKQVVVSVKADSLGVGHRYVAGTLTPATAVSANSVVVLTRRKYNPASEHDLASVAQIVAA